MMLRHLTHFGLISLIVWNSLTHIKVLKLAGLDGGEGEERGLRKGPERG